MEFVKNLHLNFVFGNSSVQKVDHLIFLKHLTIISFNIRRLNEFYKNPFSNGFKILADEKGSSFGTNCEHNWRMVACYITDVRSTMRIKQPILKTLTS